MITEPEQYSVGQPSTLDLVVDLIERWRVGVEEGRGDWEALWVKEAMGPAALGHFADAPADGFGN